MVQAPENGRSTYRREENRAVFRVGKVAFFWGFGGFKGFPSFGMVAPTEDALFRSIEGMQKSAKKPWGRFLDAGTGTHSLKWINTLDTEGFTAVTADTLFADTTRKEIGFEVKAPDEIVIGNWRNERFLEGRVFDTVLADYLVGAIDGFAPYFQDQIFERLRRHVAPGGRVYLVGMQPLPDHPGGAAELVCEAARLRDSCILLAGHRPYREYPLEWITRQMGKAGMVVVSARKMPVLYAQHTVKRQLDVAARKLPIISVTDPKLAAALEKHILDLDGRVKTALADKGGRVEVGFDYVVAAELAPDPEEPSAEPSAERSPVSAKTIDDAEQEKSAPAAIVIPVTEDEDQCAAVKEDDVDGRGGGGVGEAEGGRAVNREGSGEVEPADSETALLTGAAEVEAGAGR